MNISNSGYYHELRLLHIVGVLLGLQKTLCRLYQGTKNKLLLNKTQCLLHGPAPVDVPVNLTAEEEVDDEDIPDFRSLKLNVENPDLFVGHANGKSMSQRENSELHDGSH